MKMTDRLFPGAGVNSFLRQNGILKGFGDGEVKKIDEVASVTPEEKSQLINPNVTVPVTSNDIQANTVNGVTPLSNVSEVQDDIEIEEKTDVPLNQTESYTCPCSKKIACPCGSNKNKTESFNFGSPARDIKSVWEKFSSKHSKDAFRSGRVPKNTIEVIDKAAETVKTKLTGSDKPDEEKNAVEGFCNEHWHGVATSIVITIVVIFIVMTVMFFLAFIKLFEKDCKQCNENYISGMRGGNDKLELELEGSNIIF